MINQEQSAWSTLGTRLSDIFKERAGKLAFVEGAEDVPFADVAHAIDIMRGAGIEHVELVTDRDTPREKTAKRLVFGAISSHRPITGKIFA